MDKFLDLLNVQTVMIIYIVIGVICRKAKIINENAQSCLVTLALNVVLPCKIFASIVNDMNEINVMDSLLVIALSAAITLVTFFIGKFLFRKADPERRPSLELGTMATNAAFVGIPIAQSAFGVIGVYYTTIYMLIVIPFLWTLGLSRYTVDEKVNAWKKLLASPTTISIVLAIIFVVAKIEIPNVLAPVFDEFSASSMMMCMLPVGYMVAEIRLKDLKNASVWMFSLLRLIVLPLLVLVVLKLCKVDETITAVMVLLTSAPAPILTAMFAAKHEKDRVFATVILVVTTVLALITVPVLTLIYL